MNIAKFITGSGIIFFMLILSVTVVNHYFIQFNVHANLYTSTNIRIGFISDILRALILCYVFPYIINTKTTSLKNSIIFALSVSIVVSITWLLIGFIDLGIQQYYTIGLYVVLIYLVQGVISGISLHFLYKVNFI